jgi:hypothetical protein
MTDNPYQVVGSPNYNAPIIDWSKYFSSTPDKPTSQTPQTQQAGIMSMLTNFLNGPHGRQIMGTDAQQAATGQAGSPYQGPVAPTQINTQGTGGLY